MIYDDIWLGHHFYDNFYKFNTDHLNWRLEASEESLIEAFKLKYDFGVLGSGARPDPKWGLSRVLCGLNTNNQDSIPSSDMLMKYKNHPLHYTFEHVEWQTGLRFARSYFLNVCS